MRRHNRQHQGEASLEEKPEFRPIDRSQHELLIVDDEPASRYATARVLRSAGFRTLEVATGAEGLAQLNGSVSVMVLDVHLPDIDGFELCRVLRSRPETHRLPVLHLTAAYVTDEDKVRGLDSGADAYLTRPVEPAVLVATVQALVRTRVAEDAMRRSEAKFRTIYAHAPGGLALIDDAGRFVDANPAMLALLGCERDQVVGRPVADFAPSDFAQRAHAFFGAGRPAGVGTEELPSVTPEGDVHHLKWTISPHVEPNVNLALATDITEHIRLEEQRQQLFDRERVARSEAEHLGRMKDEFIAVLSHELRTPLNVITGWTHILQKHEGNDELKRGLEAIGRSVSMQAQLISDLTDVSRLNLGKVSLAFEPLEPAEIVRGVVNAMRPTIDTSGVTLELEVRPDLPWIQADRYRFQQVVSNLLSNALKFSSKGSKIRVRVESVGAGVVLEVTDEGQGIDPEFLPFIFDRFAQGDAVRNRRQTGLGLGLSIVKQLVEAHGGTVTASSAGLGKGATFKVQLPTEALLPASPAPDDGLSQTVEGVLDGVRLLVVEDDPEANAMLHLVLTEQGALVTSAYDFDTALAAMEKARPDLLVSDIGLPGKDGYELMRAIRKSEEGGADRLPAIALTSFTRDRDLAQGRAVGFDAHCSKPLRPLELFQHIQVLLNRPRFQATR
jgi:PAS domain S-box-containing protein